MENEKESVYVLSKEKNVKKIEDVIKEAEKDLGVNSQAAVKESEEMFDPALATIAIEVGKAFVNAVVKKYGDSFKNWLSQKLGLDKDKGEKVIDAKNDDSSTN